MLYIEGEPVPGIDQDAIHTLYGDGSVQGIASFAPNTDELEEVFPLFGEESHVLIIGMENAGFRYHAQKIMTAIRPSSIITLGVPTNHALYKNGTHLDVYLRDRAAEGDFVGLAVNKKFKHFTGEIERGEVGKWISSRVNRRLVEVSRIDADVHINLL